MFTYFTTSYWNGEEENTTNQNDVVYTELLKKGFDVKEAEDLDALFKTHSKKYLFQSATNCNTEITTLDVLHTLCNDKKSMIEIGLSPEHRTKLTNAFASKQGSDETLSGSMRETQEKTPKQKIKDLVTPIAKRIKALRPNGIASEIIDEARKSVEKYMSVDEILLDVKAYFRMVPVFAPIKVLVRCAAYSKKHPLMGKLLHFDLLTYCIRQDPCRFGCWTTNN